MQGPCWTNQRRLLSMRLREPTWFAEDRSLRCGQRLGDRCRSAGDGGLSRVESQEAVATAINALGVKFHS